MGDEGGFAPNLPSNEAALEAIAVAVDKAGYKLGSDIVLALDCAASEFIATAFTTWRVKARCFPVMPLPTIWPTWPADTLSFPLRTVLMSPIGMVGSCSPKKLGDKIQLVGDDLFVTNTKILKEGIDKGVANFYPD